MRRIPALVAVVVVAVVGSATAAWACGSLVGPNGAVQLVRTTTLAAHHDGIEHYITNFEFASEQESFGSIIPLPAEPTKVERAGDWTLQRLRQEVQPPVPLAAEGDLERAQSDQVDVLQQTRIGSLDVTILRGGGKAVADWTAEQGFALTDDTPDVLDFYADRSPYFMAAKFDAAAAVTQGFTTGDGIPVHLTIPLEDPWVPLRILSTGKPAAEVVQADVFLLTDEKPELLAGPGLALERSEPASDLLLDELRSDKNSEWVPYDAWLTYLRVDVEAGDLRYDLATDVSGDGGPRVADTGLASFDDLVVPGDGPVDIARPWPWQATVAIVGAVMVTLAAGWLLLRNEPARA